MPFNRYTGLWQRDKLSIRSSSPTKMLGGLAMVIVLVAILTSVLAVRGMYDGFFDSADAMRDFGVSTVGIGVSTLRNLFDIVGSVRELLEFILGAFATTFNGIAEFLVKFYDMINTFLIQPIQDFFANISKMIQAILNFFGG